MSFFIAPSQEKNTHYKKLETAIEETFFIDVHSHPVPRHLDHDNRDPYPTLEPIFRRPYWPNKKDRIAVFDTLQAEGLREIYGYKGTEVTAADLPELKKLSKKFWSRGPEKAFDHVLDMSGIEKTLAQGDVPETAPARRRVLWVPSVDLLFYPLNPTALRDISPGLKGTMESYYEANKSLAHHFGAGEKSLDAHLKRIDLLLKKFAQQGAVALKVLSSYYRTLWFGDVDRRTAETVYREAQKKPLTCWEEYKKLQDFLARYVFQKAGTLKLPVHFHTGFGAQATLRNMDANALKLESIFSDLRYVNTDFLVLHGGYPFTSQVKPLMEKRNVYVDFSAVSWMVFDEELAGILYEWLMYPGASEKIMFGTDAGAPVFYWIAARNTRRALYMALSRLIGGGIIDEAKGIRIAKKIIRENAKRLHRLK